MQNITEFIKQQKSSDREKLEQNLKEYEETRFFTNFDIEEVARALENAVSDYLEGRIKGEFHLYEYDEFLNEFILEPMKQLHSPEYVWGFEEVFDFMSDDEQRRFVFWKHIRHSDCFYSNNYNKTINPKKGENHWDTCLFWIVVIMD